MFIFNSADASKLQLSQDRVNLLSVGVAELSDEELAEVNGGNKTVDAIAAVVNNAITRVDNVLTQIGNVGKAAAGIPISSQGNCCPAT